MSENRERELLNELGRLAFIGSGTIIVLLIVAYFFIEALEGISPTIRDLVQAVIANLIPVFLMFFISFWLFSRIQRVVSERESDNLTNKIASRVEVLLKAESTNAPRLDMADLDPFDTKASKLEEDRRQAIRHLLRATAHAIIYPRTDTEVFIRTYCHLADLERKVLRPYCRWSTHFTEDFDVPIPYDGLGSNEFVISEAYKQKIIVAKDLPLDHIKHYPPDLQSKIHPDLKCVLAVPICNLEPEGVDVLGTISFDSVQMNLKDLNFDKKEIKDIVASCAKGIYLVMRGWRAIKNI